ncbi:type IV pilus biogenesis/stability protein PilW [Vibrio breoganii]|uniref:type IV pilus biogenesis/stability protein PilW n=1 Tax=Vibrio breoganii TaxID=553239 RepID=UPI000C81E48B|nr:type IV pilus biogenesis/stability protein PilW [Vibrio breoganii]PMI20491.1 type IV pilus biogenesis/stability protein PilW [Vibrio breoganii]PML92600.1 type IV pilus biogenesis/stability protein PilW [Vibrio breoganii]PMN74378.1 type IV pilus biogenesis/stability protein PilW [Vibrio breoganii]
MFKGLVTLFLLCLLVGCVTVDGEAGNAQFNPFKAADARIELGINYLALGHNVRAKQNLELAHRYAPNYVRASSAIAYYYQQVAEPELADIWYKKALAESPTSGDVLNDYGVFLCRRQEYTLAQRQFERAIQQSDYDYVSASYENAGLCATMQGNLRLAETYFLKSLEHEPSRFRSSIELVKLSVHFGAFSEAQQRLQHIHTRFGPRVETQQLQDELDHKSSVTQ